MKAWHRIAGTEFAALDPVDDGKEAHAEATHPAIDIRRAALHIGLGPGARPAITIAEFGKAGPVAMGKIDGVANALAALLRRIDEEHPAKAVAGQASEHALVIAIQQKDRFAPVKQIERGGYSSNPAAHDQHIAAIFLHQPCLLRNRSMTGATSNLVQVKLGELLGCRTEGAQFDPDQCATFADDAGAAQPGTFRP